MYETAGRPVNPILPWVQARAQLILLIIKIAELWAHSGNHLA